MSNLADIAAGFLHSRDVLHILAQPHHSLRQNITAGPAGYIIQYDGQLHRIGNCLKMRVQTVLSRLIVIRTHQQQAVRSCAFRFL